MLALSPILPAVTRMIRNDSQSFLRTLARGSRIASALYASSHAIWKERNAKPDCSPTYRPPHWNCTSATLKHYGTSLDSTPQKSNGAAPARMPTEGLTTPTEYPNNQQE